MKGGEFVNLFLLLERGNPPRGVLPSVCGCFRLLRPCMMLHSPAGTQTDGRTLLIGNSSVKLNCYVYICKRYILDGHNHDQAGIPFIPKCWETF